MAAIARGVKHGSVEHARLFLEMAGELGPERRLLKRQAAGRTSADQVVPFIARRRAHKKRLLRSVFLAARQTVSDAFGSILDRSSPLTRARSGPVVWPVAPGHGNAGERRRRRGLDRGQLDQPAGKLRPPS
jgi:hypothetical protein